MEQRRRVLQEGRIAEKQAIDDIAFQRRGALREITRDGREGAEIVVDDRLTGQADHNSIGLELQRLLALADGPALELAIFIDERKLRDLAAAHDIIGLEVREIERPCPSREGPRRRLVGRQQRLAGDVGEDAREVRCRHKAALGDFVRKQAAGLFAAPGERLGNKPDSVHPAIKLAGALRHLDARDIRAGHDVFDHGVAAGRLVVLTTCLDAAIVRTALRASGRLPGREMIEHRCAEILDLHPVLDGFLHQFGRK